jgi:DNA-binding GntR family transcriptional regulator
MGSPAGRRVERQGRGARSGTAGQPLAAQVYEDVRDLIVEGQLAAESPLVQEQLAERLGVSRTPVREALNRLVHEGLAGWAAGSGFFVRRLSDHEITEVAQVRENLELMALRLACGKHSRVQLAGLTTLIEEMAAADPTDFAAHFELNRRFHRVLIEPCGNNLLVGMIDQLWDHPINRRITQSYVLRDPSNVEAMVQQHRAILDAAAVADEERLLALATDHMREGYGETLSGDGALSGAG